MIYNGAMNVGARYGRLTAICQWGKHRGTRAWLFKCDCGNEHVQIPNKVMDGATRSCGCYRKERGRKMLTKHSQTNTRTWTSWMGMRQRCKYASAGNAKYYHDCGITVCDRWDDFETFLSDMGERPENMSLDRIDPYGNYEPANCRWADAITQANNKRKMV